MTKIPKIKLYELGPTRSSRVRWVLQETELHYESIQNGMEIFKSQELLSIHPLGKLPAVIIDNKSLFESAAIVTAIEKHLIHNSYLVDHIVLCQGPFNRAF